MFTPGFKLFFGIAVALATAAVIHGYTTGGTHVGPISLGWKGGVGDHLGYGILLHPVGLLRPDRVGAGLVP